MNIHFAYIKIGSFSCLLISKIGKMNNVRSYNFLLFPVIKSFK